MDLLWVEDTRGDKGAERHGSGEGDVHSFLVYL
jgi:hypothetical protein